MFNTDVEETCISLMTHALKDARTVERFSNLTQLVSQDRFRSTVHVAVHRSEISIYDRSRDGLNKILPLVQTVHILQAGLRSPSRRLKLDGGVGVRTSRLRSILEVDAEDRLY
jgi:hypothetical protein